MAQRRRKRLAWGDHPVIVAIFVIAAIVTIATFLRSCQPEQRPEEQFTVRVADPSGVSVSGAKVLLFFAGGALSQYTDSNGVSNFEISPPQKNSLRLVVEADRYQIFEREIQNPSNSAVDVRLEEREGTEMAILLRVVDDVKNIPIPGVEVILFAQGDLFRQVTDSDGFAQFTLAFSGDDKIDAQISINANEYEFENQFSTLLSGKLQYILLRPNSLRVEIPNIPSSPSTSASNSLESSVEPVTEELIGSGVEISQQSSGTGLRIVMLGPDSQPWENVYVAVFEQVADVSGNPTRGDRIGDGRINQQGLLDFELSESTYAVCPDAAPGYGWTSRDCIYNVQVSSGNLTIVRLTVGQLEVAIAGATDEPWQDVYFQVFTQRQDVNNNPVTDKSVADGRTDNRGLRSIWLTPGQYAVKVDLRGYNWGNLLEAKGDINIPVQRGTTYRLSIKMGKLTIGLRKPNGDPATDEYTEIYTQKQAIDGQSVLGDRIWYGRTNNGGLAAIDLTEGLYALKVGEDILFDIPIEWGRVTETDGKSYIQK